jgi:hypothetical protein
MPQFMKWVLLLASAAGVWYIGKDLARTGWRV